MSAWRRHPVFASWLLCCALAVGAELWTLPRLSTSARIEQARLDQARRQRDAMAQQSPAPSEKNERALTDELAQYHAAIAALRLELANGSETPPAPVKSVDAYFEFRAYEERVRSAAQKHGVMIKPAQHFGFTSYAQVGPEPANLPAVWRQQALAEQLLVLLIEARPHELLAVRRVRVEAHGARIESEDFFEATKNQPQALARSDAFRLEFTGPTAALRTFLNAVAGSKRVFLVRNVAAEPMAPALMENATGPSPLIASGLSRFSVEVEAIELNPTMVANLP